MPMNPGRSSARCTTLRETTVVDRKCALKKHRTHSRSDGSISRTALSGFSIQPPTVRIVEGIDMIDLAPYTVAHGDQTTEAFQADVNVGGHTKPAAKRRAPVPDATESDSRSSI